jgi:hypothetical protein
MNALDAQFTFKLEDRMKKISLFLTLGLLLLPAMAAAETFKDVPVVDTNCSKKVADAPDSHTRECALKCQASGFGIITSDKKFLKFDATGNKEITEALKASTKKDHLRVDVTGDVEGDTLKVTSVKLL